MQVGLAVTLLAAELARPVDEWNEQAERAVALQDDGALELGERGEPADAHGRRGLAVDIQHEVARGVVVTVELLPIRAVLLANEYGSPQHVALHQLVRCRRELDRHDWTIGHRRRLRFGHARPPR